MLWKALRAVASRQGARAFGRLARQLAIDAPDRPTRASALSPRGLVVLRRARGHRHLDHRARTVCFCM
eukprot:5028563-Prymnesium_polylepis.1